MLRELRIKNFAIIDQVALDLAPGLNVLTGETGAGKSIILDALGLISGGRAGADVIRHGEEEASVEALFDALPPAVARRIREAGYETEGELIVKRVLSRAGKNRVYLAGSLCPLGLLTEVGGALVHVYGQHEHQTLLARESHAELLDAYGRLTTEAAQVAAKFNDMSRAWKRLTDARDLVESSKRQKDFLAAQADEIAQARLRPGEEAELLERRNVLIHAEKLYQGCREGEELLYEGENALIGRLGRLTGKLRELTQIDGTLAAACDLVTSARAQLEEASSALRRYAERVPFEPGALEQLEDRLAEVQRLKRKYGGSVEAVLQRHEEIARELAAVERGEDELPGLQRAFETARDVACRLAEALSVERRKAAGRLKRELEKQCKSLGMADTVFEVRFLESSEGEAGATFCAGGKQLTGRGFDRVEFYFSPNPGEPPKPLARIASGGELSRLMLAIKSLVLTPGEIPTLLFDEVDAGIGGAVAEIVGKKLKQVAGAHQVICVTHLPQIAALADSHHVVRKQVTGRRTSMIVEKLGEGERIEELARMLGGVKITEKVRRHAEEMLRR